MNFVYIASNNTCPLYSNFFFNLTITDLFLSAVLGNKERTSTCSTGTLHNAHLNFGDWPFGMIVTSLNNSVCEIRTLSSFLTLSNCYRNQLTTSLLQTTWQGTLCFLSFSSHVLHTYSFSSNDLTSECNPSTNLLYFSSL